MPESAKVEILIDAFTEQAQQAVEEVGDKLTGLSGSATPAQSAMDEVSDELDDATTSALAAGRAFESADGPVRGLAAAMYALQTATDEAGDELNEASGSAGLASGMFAGLSVSTEGLSLAMGSLSTKVTLALIPALAALTTTLIPLAAIIGTVAAAATGLAGAFAAVIGSGILAFGKKLSKQNQKRLDQIKKEIKALKERKKARSGLTDEQQKQLKQAQKTVEQLRQKQSQTETLTDQQKKRLKQLKETRDELLKQARTEEGLTAEQQKKLTQTRESIDQLRTLREETSELTQAQRQRLEQAQQTIKDLQEQASAEGSLTKKEKQRLKQLKEKRDKLQKQTSVTGALTARLSELKDEILPLIVAFGQQFVPLIEDAVAAIPTLIRNIGDAVGGFDVFKQALRDIGNAAMTAIPNIVSALLDLARQALPAMMELGNWLLQNGGSIFQGMIRTTKELAPEFMSLIDSFISAIPAMNRLGTFILEGLVPALADLFAAVKRLLGDVNFAQVAKSMRLNDRSARMLRQGIADLVKGLAPLKPLLTEIWKGIKTDAIPAIGGFIGVVGRLAQAFGSLPLWAQKAALVAILGVVGALGGPFTALAAAIGIVAVAFDEMAAAAEKAMNFLEGIWDLIQKIVTTDLPFQVNAQTARRNPNMEQPDPPGSNQSGQQGQGSQGVVLDVRGDGLLADVIDQSVEAKQQDKNRRDQRRIGRQSPGGAR